MMGMYDTHKIINTYNYNNKSMSLVVVLFLFKFKLFIWLFEGIKVGPPWYEVCFDLWCVSAYFPPH